MSNPDRLRARRARVITRFARLGERDVPMTCDVGRARAKIIYDTAEDAAECAAALARAMPAIRPMEPYPCDRDTHYHLRTIRSGSQRSA